MGVYAIRRDIYRKKNDKADNTESVVNNNDELNQMTQSEGNIQ